MSNLFSQEKLEKIFKNVVCWNFYPACKVLKSRDSMAFSSKKKIGTEENSRKLQENLGPHRRLQAGAFIFVKIFKSINWFSKWLAKAVIKLLESAGWSYRLTVRMNLEYPFFHSLSRIAVPYMKVFFSSEKYQYITKTRLFKYIENLTSKNWKFSYKKSIFHISAQNIDCGYSLELPHWGGSNEYPQSMLLSRNKKNNVYPCKPQFHYIKMGFKGVKII